jgi:hypothetical protein
VLFVEVHHEALLRMQHTFPNLNVTVPTFETQEKRERAYFPFC